MGAVAARSIVTDCELVPPALVALQVSVMPLVSALIVVDPQPELDEMSDSLSVTVQLTVTSLVYQPLLPSAPAMFGTMLGALVSLAAQSTAVAVTFIASVRAIGAPEVF